MQPAVIKLLILALCAANVSAQITTPPPSSTSASTTGSAIRVHPSQAVQIDADFIGLIRSLRTDPAPILSAAVSYLDQHSGQSALQQLVQVGTAQSATGIQALATYATAPLATPSVDALTNVLPTEYREPLKAWANGLNCQFREIVRDDLGLQQDAVQSDCLPAATSINNAPAPSVAAGARGAEMIAGGAMGVAGAAAAVAALL